MTPRQPPFMCFEVSRTLSGRKTGDVRWGWYRRRKHVQSLLVLHVSGKQRSEQEEHKCWLVALCVTFPEVQPGGFGCRDQRGWMTTRWSISLGCGEVFLRDTEGYLKSFMLPFKDKAMWFSLIYAISKWLDYLLNITSNQFVIPPYLNKASFLTETDQSHHLLTCWYCDWQHNGV